MAVKPYRMTREIRVDPTSPPRLPLEWRYEAELSDTPNVSAQRERLTILTHVPAPLPADAPELPLAALLRVRDLLDQQIAAMRSP